MNRLIVLAGITAMLSVGSADAGVITSAGSTTVQPAMKACAKAYKKSHADMQFIIAGGGSSKGVKTAARGKVDIGRASRAIKDKEAVAHPDLKTFKLATDGVVLVINAANTISALSSAQVEQLFKGEVDNWQAVGGPDAPVKLISMGTEHGTYELFSHHFHLKGVESDGNLMFDHGQAWIAFSQDIALEKVAHDKNAITFASVGVAGEFAQNGDVKLLNLDGVEPTTENVVNGTYKLSRPLLLLTRGAPSGEIKDFIDYMQAAECQSIVKELGYIPNL
ncbi:MAG: phosphate-binding protein [Zetaproteobacteria bacterium CG12_big_fil_rev_8_21_14_0_65_54_13]|nr:MAG: phosphate-binding protein [Zetaproteobacteria bacterium CG12_big_fil_rev_8_21_14_0_65_54_13]PIX53740.1 MAG: phosphate-binding protein [Zetaproteobacteria bacterium CG_4_10_14_3_um_filter_54_28]PJA31165.1 MAG: phosphate-binding protein [Zetaproteobacteria bacterium CG_4_9_14_3_um_filter_54_145]